MLIGFMTSITMRNTTQKVKGYVTWVLLITWLLTIFSTLWSFNQMPEFKVDLCSSVAKKIKYIQ
jgi:disulfide bond formation protein DsbB